MRSNGTTAVRSRVPELREAPATSQPAPARAPVSRFSGTVLNQRWTIVASLILTAMLLVGGIGYGLYAASEKDHTETTTRPTFRDIENENRQPVSSIGGNAPSADAEPDRRTN